MLLPFFEPVEQRLQAANQTKENSTKLRRAQQLMRDLIRVRTVGLRDDTEQFQRELQGVVERHGLRAEDLRLLAPFLAGAAL
jgi:hypothetical protein